MTLELATSFGAAVTAYLVGYFNRNALEGLFAGFLCIALSPSWARGGKIKNEEAPLVDNNGQTVIPPYEPQRYPSGCAPRWWPVDSRAFSALAAGPIKVPVMFLFMNVPLMSPRQHPFHELESPPPRVPSSTTPPWRHPRGYRGPARGWCISGLTARRPLAPRIRTKYVCSICWSRSCFIWRVTCWLTCLREVQHEPASANQPSIAWLRWSCAWAPSVVSSSCWLVCWWNLCPRPHSCGYRTRGRAADVGYAGRTRGRCRSFILARKGLEVRGNLFRSTRNPAGWARFSASANTKAAN